MNIRLNIKDIKKILSTITIETIENKLDTNYIFWEVDYGSGIFTLTRNEKVQEK